MIKTSGLFLGLELSFYFFEKFLLILFIYLGNPSVKFGTGNANLVSTCEITQV